MISFLNVSPQRQDFRFTIRRVSTLSPTHLKAKIGNNFYSGTNEFIEYSNIKFRRAS